MKETVSLSEADFLNEVFSLFKAFSVNEAVSVNEVDSLSESASLSEQPLLSQAQAFNHDVSVHWICTGSDKIFAKYQCLDHRPNTLVPQRSHSRHGDNQ